MRVSNKPFTGIPFFEACYFGRSVIISTALSYTTIAPIGALVISTSLKYESAGKRFVYANYKYQKMIHE